MKKRSPVYLAALLLTLTLAACNPQQNPLLGTWQEENSPSGSTGYIIEFTPSTMRINDRVVTVVYQIRGNKVRVSASKKAIIYEFEDDNVIHYEDEERGIIRMIRLVNN